MSMETANQPKRYPNIDLIRCMAMILVIFVHLGSVVAPGHALVLSVIRGIGTCGVPLFVMMTGYLLLGRSYEGDRLEVFLRRNMLPLLVAFEVWNALWFFLGKIDWLLPGGNGLPINAGRAARAALFVGDTGTALWYLHMTIALYLGIPIVAWAIRRVSVTYRRVLLIALVFFATVVPSASELSAHLGVSIGVRSVIGMNIFSATVWGGSVWTLYLLAGYAIRKGWLNGVRSSVLAAVLCASFGVFILIYFRSVRFSLPNCNSYSFLCVVISSITLFALLLRFGSNQSVGRFAKILEWVASRSFGVYVVHLWAIGGVYSALRLIGFGPEVIGSSSTGVSLLGFIGCLVSVLAISLIVVHLLSKSRQIRRWVLLMK